MPATDQPDWTTQTNISAGTVTLSSNIVDIGAGQSGNAVTINTPPKKLGTITIAAHSNAYSGTFNLDADATGLVVLLNVGGYTPGVLPSVQIKGGVTGIWYANEQSQVADNAMNGVVACASILGTVDNPVTVSGAWNNGGSASAPVIATVLEVFGTGVQQVYTNTQDPLPIIGTDQIASPQNAPLTVQGRAANGGLTIASGLVSIQDSLGLQLNSDGSGHLQAVLKGPGSSGNETPRALPAILSKFFGVVANGAQCLSAPSAGQAYYIYAMQAESGTGGSIDLAAIGNFTIPVTKDLATQYPTTILPVPWKVGGAVNYNARNVNQNATIEIWFTQDTA